MDHEIIRRSLLLFCRKRPSLVLFWVYCFLQRKKGKPHLLLPPGLGGWEVLVFQLLFKSAEPPTFYLFIFIPCPQSFEKEI